MNWLTLSVLGAVALWFEYSYRRSRKKKAASDPERPGGKAEVLPVPASAQVAETGNSPSISPGSENDKKLNSSL